MTNTRAHSFAGDPILAWDEAVAAKVREGFQKARAIAAVVREQPELHVAYLEAYNTAHGRPIPANRPGPAPTQRQHTADFRQPRQPAAIRAWEELLGRKMGVGRTRAEAVRELVREEPELHAAYLEAYNAQHKPARR